MSLPVHRHRQRGAALLTAMIIVTLVATLAASMVWQQWRAVQVEVAERGRLQSAWMLSGALEWAKLILREDAKASPGVDHLGEPWAVPLAEARLSTFLAADKDNTDDAPEAFLSGSITDAQSRFNLRDLIDSSNNKVSATGVTALRQLLEAINLSPDLADRVANAMKEALTPPGTEGAVASPPLMPQNVQQLTWLGVDADTIRQMEPYVALLPMATTVNLNTASPEVLMAAIAGLDRGSAQRLVQARQHSPFKSLADVTPLLPANIAGNLQPQLAGTNSVFYVVRGRLRLTDRVLEESSLVERRGLDIVTIWRQRENSRESSG
jgi:general secretion pathway protein K